MEYGAVVVWWLLFIALAVTGFPIAARLFDSFPDRGAGLALPLALSVLVIPIYWFGHLAFTPITIGAGVLVLAGVAGWAAWTGPQIDVTRFTEMLVVFTLGFGLLVAVRAVDPSIHPLGGEKFLDFGLLNTILRASQLPPQDMWFAGEPVQYYYGGHLIAAVLTALTGTPARLAYNLALAGFYGTLVATAYGVTGTIAAWRTGAYRLAGALGALLVGLASNLVTPLQLVLWSLPRELAGGFASAIASLTALPEEALVSFRRFSYWTASRVIRDNDGGVGYSTINEFPLFAFINGDLHAHMMSTPFLLLVIGLAFAYYQTSRTDLRRRRLLIFGCIPPLAAFIAVINTWSFPSVLGVTWLALIFGAGAPSDLLPGEWAPPGRAWQEELSRIAAATVATVSVAVIGIIWALPFFIGPATGAGGRSIGVFPPRSGLLEFVLVHGWVIAVYTAYLGLHAGSSIATDRARVAAMMGIILAASLLVDAAAMGLLLPLLVLAWVLLRQDTDVGFEAVLFIAGAGLVLLVEFVFLQEQAGPGRMNTVFKTYMQVWILWGVATGIALARLIARRTLPVPISPRARQTIRIAGIVLLAALLLYSLVAVGVHFGAFTTDVRGPTEPTLDATTWAATNHPVEWEAIQWLDRRSGQPHIVTAPGCWCNRVPETRPYNWVNAPSSFTGIPTLAGWSHEAGYRGQSTYRSRVDDVGLIYTGSSEERVRLLQEYDVEYIYVGPTERALYGEDLDFAAYSGVSVAFENQAVTIYAISPRELDASMTQ